MLKWLYYYGQLQSIGGNVGGLPRWGRLVLLVFALPGIVLAALSIAAFLVSLLALLVLTVPVYRLLRTIRRQGTQAAASAMVSAGRRPIEVKIIE